MTLWQSQTIRAARPATQCTSEGDVQHGGRLWRRQPARCGRMSVPAWWEVECSPVLDDFLKDGVLFFCFCFSRRMVKPRLWCAEAWRGWLRATQNRHHRSRFVLLLLGDADGRLQRRLRKEQMNGRTDWQIDWLMDDGLTEGQRIWDFCSCCFSGTGW